MPCMGPSYSEPQANEATKAVLKFMERKYNLLKGPDNHPIWGKDRRRIKNRMKAIVHEMFKIDCYENF